ncbi:PHP domain-containing protein [Candidatus Poribacteria bacterium]|nr:PHP domain-containing protein [Candidatus Poribacteria bacterium]
MNFEYDYHVHTKLSYCHEGELTVDNLLSAAKEKGLRGFAITDHTSHLYFERKIIFSHEHLRNYSIFLDAIGTERDNFVNYLDMLELYKDQNVLTGTETDADLNGELIFDWRYRDRVDILMGGVHWLPCLDDSFDSKTFLVQFMDTTMALLENGIDILAHPTRLFRARNVNIPSEVVPMIVKKAKEKGTAIELNSHNQLDMAGLFVRPCIEEGVKLSVGTDTHRLYELGGFSYHRELLSKFGITEDDLDEILFNHANLSYSV